MNGSPSTEVSVDTKMKRQELRVECGIFQYSKRVGVGEERPDSSSDIWRKRKLLKPMLWQFPLFLESSSIPEHRKVGNRSKGGMDGEGGGRIV